ncbi:MAG: hypothetical protein M3430_20715 [Acidobacteriota bacterium]|nr:hypothetical protein [Acidobacteriota bacterium]
MMRKMRDVVCVCVMVVSVCAVVVGQSTPRVGSNEAVSRQKNSEVITDKSRVSGATTITLKPQRLIDTPERLLLISAVSKVGDKPITGLDEADERVMLKFDLQTTGVLDGGDQELHFLVDGERIKAGSVAGGGSPLLRTEPVRPYTKRQTYSGSLSIPTLGRIARGKKVEISMGSIEATLDTGLLNKLDEFVRYYQQAKGTSRP